MAWQTTTKQFSDIVHQTRRDFQLKTMRSCGAWNVLGRADGQAYRTRVAEMLGVTPGLRCPYYKGDQTSANTSAQSSPQPGALLPVPMAMKRALPQDDTLSPYNDGQRKKLRLDGESQQPIPSIEVSPKITVPERRTTPHESTVTNDSSTTTKRAYPTADTLVPAIVFQRLPRSTQNFLRGVDMSTPGALILARSIAELGARFGQIATEEQLIIGYKRLSQSTRMPALFNALTPESKYVLFWKWVQEATGKYTPAPALTRPPVSSAEIKTQTPAVDTRLKTHLVKQIDARGPGVLDERVRKWMDNIIPSYSA